MILTTILALYMALPLSHAIHINTTAATPKTAAINLSKRYTFTTYMCNPAQIGGYAQDQYISAGVNYLEKIKGEQPSNQPGKCGRVSCEWSSAISWCNWNDYVLSLPSFAPIADGAKYLQNVCGDVDEGSGVEVAGEVIAGEEGWSVVVRYADSMEKEKYTFTTSSHPPATTTKTSTIYPTPTTPHPPTNHPVFSHALAVRHAVFVVEQHCSADAEIDDDDARSWEWVIYASPLSSQQQQQQEEGGGGGENIPVAVIRLVPPPHYHHTHFSNTTTTTDANANTEDDYDYDHEAYIKITRVAVLPAFRGYGLARILMAEVERWAARHKHDIDLMYALYRNKDKDKDKEKEKDKENGNGNEREETGWNGLIGLHAQTQVQHMYARLGYVTDESMGTWEEEGIGHVGMFKRVELDASTK